MTDRIDSPGRQDPSCERGFSLIELVVATLVLSVALLFVAQGLDEARRLFVDTQRIANVGSTELATALLRRDARSARALSGPVGAWTSRPLTLFQPDDTRIVYAPDGDRLGRRAFDAGNRPLALRAVARNLRTFRWRRTGDGLLEIEIDLRTPPPAPRALGRLGASDHARATRERITVALRSRARSGW